MERLTKRINGVVTYIGKENKYGTGMIAAETLFSVSAVREILLRLAAYEDTGYEPEEIPAAIQEAAKASEHNTACIMAEVIAGAMKDTIDKYCTPPVSSTL